MLWILVVPALATTWVGTDWGGADLLPVDGDVLSGTFTNVGAFVIPANARVFVDTAVELDVTAGQVTIDGWLDGDGAGHSGRTPGSDGRGPGGGSGDDSGISGAGGGGYGGRGGAGDHAACPVVIPGFAGGVTYGVPDDPLATALGSAGGFEWNRGGNGGGSVAVRGDTVTVGATGKVTANGGPGVVPGVPEGGGGSGGGSGGTIVLDAVTLLDVQGALSARGGRGGRGDTGYCSVGGGGGGGGGGRVKLYGPVAGSVGANVGGGDGAATDGAPRVGDDGFRGTIWVDALLAAGSPSLALSGSCPAGVDLTVTDGSGLGQVMVLVGTGLGADTLATGRCAGTPTGLAGVTERRTLVLDPNGERTTTVAVPSGLCGMPAQVVDLWTCRVSAVGQLP